MRAQEHHKKVMAACMNADFGLLGIHAHILATHFGDFVAANEWVFDRLPLLWERAYEEPNQSNEALNIVCHLIYLGNYGVLVGQSQRILPFFTRAGVKWSTIDSWMDDMCASVPNVRPRGDT